MTPKKYLITGGAGFIGSHFCDRLLADGHSVHVVDNLSTGRLANIQHLHAHDGFSYTVGDVRDSEMMERFVRDADIVIHLAAAVGVRLIMDKPVETIVTNVLGTETVLRLCSQYDKTVVIASTSEVYGKMMEVDSRVTALGEQSDIVLGPTTKRRWAYACSKAMDEFLALAYSDEKRLPVIVVRFFNTVGPRQASEYGMVIPTFVQRALLGEPIAVYGDGEQARCFTHVADAITAVRRLLDNPAAIGGVFNVGNDQEISMNDLAERVREIARSSSEIIHVPYESIFRHGFEDMRRRTPDLRHLREFIPYAPEHTIDDIIAQVVDAFRHGTH